MKRIVGLVVLLVVVAVPVACGSAAGLEDAEFRLGLNPALHLGSSGLTFDVWTLGWTHRAGAPLLMFGFGLTFLSRMAVTVTSSMSGDEPFVFLGRFLSVYASLGLERLQPADVYDWYGEIGVMLTLMDGVHITIGYGSSAWLNVGVGLTTTLHDMLAFISRNADRSLL